MIHYQKVFKKPICSKVKIATRKMKFSIKIFFSTCKPNCRFQSISPHLLKENLTENLFCCVAVMFQALLF